MSNQPPTAPANDAGASDKKAVTEAAESKVLVRYGFELARELAIDKVLVFAGLLSDQRLVEKHREEETLIWVGHQQASDQPGDHEFYVDVPNHDTEQLAQVTMGLMIAVLHGVVEMSESVVCLTGVAGSKRLDNLLIANAKRDFPWFSRQAENDQPQKFDNLREFIRTLDIALRLASEGREGKHIGTVLVIGDLDELEPYLRPLILNPLKGHNRSSRSIFDPEFLETIREFASLDGAFVIDQKGVVERAGVYLDAPISKQVKVAKGLGSRHVAAASLSAKTNATAIVISESSGKVTVFNRGEVVMALDGRPS